MVNHTRTGGYGGQWKKMTDPGEGQSKVNFFRREKRQPNAPASSPLLGLVPLTLSLRSTPTATDESGLLAARYRWQCSDPIDHNKDTRSL